MKIERIKIKNFRRLEDVTIDMEDRETIFVGPNNSGKTSATAVFRCFLGQRNFRIYDFSVSKIGDIDTFGLDGNADNLPEIELDIWVKIDPESIEFGRAFTLLPNLSGSFERLGVRLTFVAGEPAKMRDAYLAAYPANDAEPSAVPLSEYLSQDDIFRRHFQIKYAALEDSEQGYIAKEMDKQDGKKLLQNLVRIDFVDAQRNIDDEEGHRSNRLSNAFAGYYNKNLELAETAAEAHKVIDDNNAQLTEHYEEQFKPLMAVIKGLGVPSVNDRALQIVSTLDPHSVLKGNTELLYVDEARNHKLPELYNGLGFKNLIYMAIQAKHFHSQWLQTPVNRPLCQIIFIEEPEVHLHAQVQQTFIQNVWDVIQNSAKEEKEPKLVPQLILTTHSSHILDATEFSKVRYFRRCHLADEDKSEAGVLNATQVHSLRDFKPEAVDIEDQKATKKEALEFLKRYLRLTHCDLFFTDAAIIVEGSVEKLLLPTMIDKSAKKLQSSYLTILEIGGAYAHRFEGLLSFLHIPHLIITDIDAVEPTGCHSACRADTAGALTSNASLKKLLNVSSIGELMQLNPEQRADEEQKRFVSFQKDVKVTAENKDMQMRPRTLEEAFAYENFDLLRDGSISLGIAIPDDLNDAYDKIYNRVKSSSFKKTDFAMSVLATDVQWEVPAYITDGLKWLEQQLNEQTTEL